MLKETEETIDFFVTFLWLVTFQLGRAPLATPMLPVELVSAHFSTTSHAVEVAHENTIFFVHFILN